MTYPLSSILAIWMISARRLKTPYMPQRDKNIEKEIKTPRRPIISHSPDNMHLSVLAHQVPSQKK